MNLLSKSRKINSLLQNAAGKSVNFKGMSETLCEVIEANVFIISRRGKVLGFAVHQQIENDRMKQMLEDRQFPEEYTNNLATIRETSSNLDVNSEHSAFPVENKDLFKDGLTTIIPIIGGGDRLGTLIIARVEKPIQDDETAFPVDAPSILRVRSVHLSRDARLAQPLGQLVDVRLIAKWEPADVLGK